MPRRTLNREQVERLRTLIPQVLERSYDRLSVPGQWTQGASARRPGGESVSALDPKATQWCAIGALERCSYEVYLDRVGPTNRTRPPKLEVGWDTLFRMSQAEFVKTVREVVASYSPHDAAHIEIPSVNDRTDLGYPVIINAFAKATGKAAPPVAEAAMERARALRARALKGWATRRARMAERHAVLLDQMRQQQAMTFGGTIQPSPISETTEVTV